MRLALTVCLLAAVALPAAAQTITVFQDADPATQSMGPYKAAGAGAKDLDLVVGIGSGAWHGPDDAPFRFWMVGDRGPNIGCSDAEKILGVKAEVICAAAPKGRIYSAPGVCALDLCG